MCYSEMQEYNHIAITDKRTDELMGNGYRLYKKVIKKQGGKELRKEKMKSSKNRSLDEVHEQLQ